ncbi:hypothetical protein RJT34_11601 [Clitoria ternatea]|uniref:C2H2-type domain-containing protein n=1 Tax=Clitoria ternatea TaxID=43366 RepID=A0AAN9PKN1_CLITE
MYVKREQILKSHLEAPVVDYKNKNRNYSSWEERAFAEDAARVLGGSIWPPRSYSCTFCKREFRSAQALGGHMNIHRRDRARLKQNLSPHDNNYDHQYPPLDNHHKNYYSKSLLYNHYHPSAAEISTQIDCCLSAYSSPATTITTTRVSANTSPCSVILEQNYKGCPNSEPEEEGVINARENYNPDGLLGGCNGNHVETSLSVGLTSMFGQKSSPKVLPCGDSKANKISCKRLKTTISSLPLFLKPCSNDKVLAFQPAESVLGLNHGLMEDLDLELRLGKQQKVK